MLVPIILFVNLVRGFVNLVRDELKIKYGGTRFQRYAGCPTEAAAILWMKREMGWTQTIPERMPT